MNPTTLPSRKWLATQITAVAALLTAFVTAGSWNQTLSIALIGVVTQAVVGYLLPNAEPASGDSTDTPTSAAHLAASAAPTSASGSAATARGAAHDNSSKVRQRQTSSAAGPCGPLVASYLATRGNERIKVR